MTPTSLTSLVFHQPSFISLASRSCLLVGLLLSACGGDGSGPSLDGGSTGNTGINGTGTGSTGTTNGTTTNGGTNGGPGGTNTSSPDGGSNGSVGECGGNRYDAETKQLDIYMIVDESGSMIPWWGPVLQAIEQFLASPDAAGIGVGLQLFGDSCDPNTYATPRVPIAPLPDNAQAIRSAFPLFPSAGTPTQPALQGAIQHATDWSNSHPDSKVVVLLVTDGLPDDCQSTVENVTEVARQGFEGSPSIPTYVVGLPLLEPLNPIAQAGGTQQAYAADPSNAQALVDTLNAVRGMALPCDYALPADAEDPSLVNLDYRTTDGTTSRIPKLPGPDACASSPQGWYYDPQNASRIVACDQTCDMFKSAGGQVDVVLGCPTVITI